MDIEKMYNDTKKQISNLEENYMKQLLKQDNLYYKQLNKVIEIYPSSQLSETDTEYTTQLSSLNGISKTIDTLHSTLQDNVQKNDRNLKQSNKEITNLKKMSSNLDTNENIDELDLTSKRLLNDNINIYSTNRQMIWIKGILVAFLSYILFSDAMKHPELKIYIILWVICLLILFVISYFINKWKTSTRLPTSATSGPVEASSTCSVPTLSCNNTQYGCCPDGVTASDENKLNCGCAQSTYGCCPDGSNKTADGCVLASINPVPCNQTTYGCCLDNVTISNSTGSNCNNKSTQPPTCSTTQYGCCPDGSTTSNSDRSNCVGSCAFSEFGCCPNGVTISNKDRSNCIVPMCSSSKYGCCPNGTTRNKIGSNC